VDVVMEIFLDLLKFATGQHEGVAGVGRQGIAVGETTDRVDCVTDLLRLAPSPALVAGNIDISGMKDDDLTRS
jgi:hypothetical protein